MKVEITKKTLTWLATMFGVTVASVLATIQVCDNINAKADTRSEKKYQDNFDKCYSIKHAPCSTAVTQLAENMKIINNSLGNIKLSLKIISMAKKREMTFYQKQEIVQELVTHDSISYDSAYALLDMPIIKGR